MSTQDARQSRPCGADDDAEAPEPTASSERPGLPDPATVVSEETLISPKGRRYRILKTRQTDGYDDVSEADEPHAQGGRRVTKKR